MDLWHGHITFDDRQPAIQDLHFSHPHESSLALARDACLCFLAVVQVGSVPLHLAVGPSLDVWTNHERTQEWLHHYILNDGGIHALSPWWQTSVGQSENGILLGVRGCDEAAHTSLKITEVLLYAASNFAEGVNAPPTPPASSSPSCEDPPVKSAPKPRLYALPLSSHIFRTLDHLPPFNQCGTVCSDQAFYLPFPTEPSACTEDNPVQKRAKIETLFSDATQNRRLQKKQGGAGVAKAMAGTDDKIIMPLPSSAQPDPMRANGKAPATRGPLSRASTTGSITSLRSIDASASRPKGSRRPTFTNGQRSSLHRVESALSPSVDGINSPVPDDGTNNIEKQNKGALSRIIMAGMRMYGYQQQRKKPISGASDSQCQISATTTADQDEYKAIYHQTFKAASFVFRESWMERALGQEALRDTVDVFLNKFCQDPLAEKGLEDALNGEFGFPT
ncbi:MAG: hypothetical protein Q9201_007179 [Fulgogasparrea decipioides]